MHDDRIPDILRHRPKTAAPVFLISSWESLELFDSSRSPTAMTGFSVCSCTTVQSRARGTRA
jgi:hypothetical protein